MSFNYVILLIIISSPKIFIVGGQDIFPAYIRNHVSAIEGKMLMCSIVKV